MKKALLIFAVLAVVVAGWLIYFTSDSSLTKVSGVEAKNENITIKIELTGEVYPIKSYSVMSTLGGKISRLYVAEGDRVKKGDNLLKLDESTSVLAMYQNQEALKENATAAALANANNSSAASVAALDKAKVALALSQTTGIDYESFNEALSGKIKEKAAAAASMLSSLIPSENTSVIEQYTNGLNKTSTGNDVLTNAIQAELTQKSNMQGKVLKVNVNEGEILAPGVPAMVIADDSSLKIRCLANENDLKRIDDQEVNIITRSDDLLYKGQILSKSQAAAKPSGEYTGMEAVGEVYITPQGGFAEIIGSSVDVEIILNEVKDVICLPLDCITGDNFVYVIKSDNTLEKRTVVKGLMDGYNAQILSGIAAGEKVAANPDGLMDGEKVKIID